MLNRINSLNSQNTIIRRVGIHIWMWNEAFGFMASIYCNLQLVTIINYSYVSHTAKYRQYTHFEHRKPHNAIIFELHTETEPKPKQLLLIKITLIYWTELLLTLFKFFMSRSQSNVQIPMTINNKISHFDYIIIYERTSRMVLSTFLTPLPLSRSLRLLNRPVWIFKCQRQYWTTRFVMLTVRARANYQCKQICWLCHRNCVVLYIA